MRRIRSRLTYANVAATLALVIAVAGGTAYAANSVFSTDIVDGEVKTPDIASNAVGTGKIGNNQVFSDDVRDDTLTGGGLAAADLRSGSVGTAEVSTGGVRGVDVQDQSLTGADIADQSGVDTCVQSIRVGQLCFRVENFERVWTEALAHCANLDLRLPTLGEALELVQTHDLPGVDESEFFWTDEYGSNDAWVVDDAGNPAISGIGVTTKRETVCVTTPTN